jgi:hypothetical protein
MSTPDQPPYTHTIRGGVRNHLVISQDQGEDNQATAVLLFTPDMRHTIDHHHSELDRTQAVALRSWLTAYLARTA